jgi:protein gp37
MEARLLMPTAIEWTDETWNPIRARNKATGKTGWHCVHMSEGCRNCYAERLNVKPGATGGTGLPYKPGHEKDIEIFLDERALLAPLGWKRPRRIFVCSMTDLFADFVADEWLDRLFAVMALCPQHTFQVLTKRPERMRAWFTTFVPPLDLEERIRVIAAGILKRRFGVPDEHPRDTLSRLNPFPWPLPHVWLGVSAENQETAAARIPELLQTPAARRFVSAEPLLGPVDLHSYMWPVCGWWKGDFNSYSAAKAAGADCGLRRQSLVSAPAFFLDWIIVGGESGPRARPMHPDWVRSLRDQCAAAGAAFFFKQWGEWSPSGSGRSISPEGSSPGPEVWNEKTTAFVRRLGKKKAGRTIDGVIHDGMPVTA